MELREKIIKKAKELPEGESFFGDDRDSLFDDAFIDGVNFALDEIIAIMPHWISVDKELPEEKADKESDWVIISDGFDERVGFYHFPDQVWCDRSGDECIVSITHWMPLLPMPKEQP